MLNLSHPTVDVAITCSNFAASLDFYHNKLGFEIVLDLEIPDALRAMLDLPRLASGRFGSRQATRSLN